MNKEAVAAAGASGPQREFLIQVALHLSGLDRSPGPLSELAAESRGEPAKTWAKLCDGIEDLRRSNDSDAQRDFRDTVRFIWRAGVHWGLRLTTGADQTSEAQWETIVMTAKEQWGWDIDDSRTTMAYEGGAPAASIVEAAMRATLPPGVAGQSHASVDPPRATLLELPRRRQATTAVLGSPEEPVHGERTRRMTTPFPPPATHSVAADEGGRRSDTLRSVVHQRPTTPDTPRSLRPVTASRPARGNPTLPAVVLAVVLIAISVWLVNKTGPQPQTARVSPTASSVNAWDEPDHRPDGDPPARPTRRTLGARNEQSAIATVPMIPPEVVVGAESPRPEVVTRLVTEEEPTPTATPEPVDSQVTTAESPREERFVLSSPVSPDPSPDREARPDELKQFLEGLYRGEWVGRGVGASHPAQDFLCQMLRAHDPRRFNARYCRDTSTRRMTDDATAVLRASSNPALADLLERARYDKQKTGDQFLPSEL